MDPLVEAFKFAGQRFGKRLRELLPIIATGTPTQVARARVALQLEAELASQHMGAGAREFLSKSLAKAVKRGQMSAATSIGAEFGAVNRRLVEALALQFAKPLAAATQSPKQFLQYALRETTAIGMRRATTGITPGFSMPGPKETIINRSLAQSTLSKSVSRETSRQLLKDLGLNRNDQVLYMSGRRLRALDYARMVTRTRLAEAENMAKAEEFLSNGVEFIETSKHQVKDTNDICYFLQGKVWALRPNPYGIPVLPAAYGLPPWHPYCMHTFGAWIPAFNGGTRALLRIAKSHEGDARKLAAWAGDTEKRAA